MKEVLVQILITFGIISPFYSAEPPQINTDGLTQRETVITETTENTVENLKLPFTEEDIVLIAKTLYGECRGCPVEEQAQVVWCILNRVDDERFPDTILGVITQPNQFDGYSSSFPVWDNLKDIARDVLTRWSYEKQGITVERQLAPEYVFFTGNGHQNIFRTEY